MPYTNNSYLKKTAETTIGETIEGTHPDNYYLKIISENIGCESGGGSNVTKTSDLTNDGSDGVNPFVDDSDSRLTDARTPTSHTHTVSEITDFPTIPTTDESTLTTSNDTYSIKDSGVDTTQIKDDAVSFAKLDSSEITTVTASVTYANNTTETFNLIVYDGS